MLGAELEALAADATAGEIGRASKHALPPGTPCKNCDTPLQGAWCHACGQKGEDYHRSIRHLIAEAFEGLTHFDGRFWNTLPRLIIKPGALTRDYLEGKRASQIPPFRLFLVVLLVVFFVGGLGGGSHEEEPAAGAHGEAAAKPDAQVGDVNINIGEPSDIPPEARQKFETKLDQLPLGSYTKEKVKHASQNHEAVMRSMEHWSHRFAILTLPLAALILSGLYAFRRGVYVFDHLIFSMHSLSFQGLLFSAITLLAMLSGAAWWLVLAAPAHLFVHMRGVYGGGKFVTLMRMALLFVASSIAFGFLMLALVIVGVITAH